VEDVLEDNQDAHNVKDKVKEIDKEIEIENQDVKLTLPS
jgi:hypothetical protein